MLLVAAVVSIVVGAIKDGWGGLIDGASIFLALIIITAVSSWNNYNSERKLRDLLALTDKTTVPIFRDSNNPNTVDSEMLVVGDVF